MSLNNPLHPMPPPVCGGSTREGTSPLFFVSNAPHPKLSPEKVEGRSCPNNLSCVSIFKNAGASFPLKALAISLMMSFAANVYALPAGGVVSAGSAGISSVAGSTTIIQSTQNAAINWQSFNIGHNEAVQFVQPNSNSIVLNRVLGPDPSNILGDLSANGKVFLVNPNGILFGKGAQVNVGGLVASTLNITDSGFMAGNYNFSGTNNGTVSNQGTINTVTNGGYVALLGANVSNDGIITAKLGTVVLAAGTAITIDVAGDGLLNITVNQGEVNALIRNGGLIQADGGQVLLTAQAAGNLLQSAVNNTGVIRAQTVENRNGTIKLLADMQRGTLNVGGTLDASAPNSGNGGFIETSGSRVLIADSARIDTLAPQGKTGLWLLDPTDFTIAASGGDMTAAALVNTLLASNVTISSNNGLVGSNGDINVNAPVHWAGATTLTLNAVHDVLVNAPMTADTAGANIVLTAGHDVDSTATLTVVAAVSSININAGNDVRVGGVLTATAANSVIGISAVHDVITTAIINAVAANSSVTINAGNDVQIGGAITGTAGNTTIEMIAGLDVISSAAITAVAAGSTISMNAGRDVTTTNTAPILAVAATTVIDLVAARDVNVNSAIAAGAAGSTISMKAGNNVNVISAIAAGAAGSSILLNAGQNVNVTGAVSAGSSIVMEAGLNGSGPGIAGGTVTIAGAVTALNTTIRFNPNGYANTSAEIAAYIANATGTVDAKAWVFAEGNNKIYDGANAATLTFVGSPADGGFVTLLPGTATFGNTGAGTGKTVTFNGYTISGANVVDFVLFASSGITTANITPAPLTVTASDVSKTYGQTPTLTHFTTTGLVAGETIGSVSETSPGAAATAGVGGGPYAITPGSATGGTFLASNYIIGYANGALKVIPANLTVTASNYTKTYGQTEKLSAFTTAGLLTGETVGSVTETSPGTAATASVGGGPYAITPGSATGGTFTASNYAIGYIKGALTVNPTGLTVTAADATKTYGQTMILTAFTTDGLVNGETIGAFTETSPGTAASASILGSPYVITLGRAGGGTFTATNYTIVYVNGALTVIPLIQTVPVGVAQGAASILENAVMPAPVLAEPPSELLSVVPSALPVLPDTAPVETPALAPAPTPPNI